MREFIEGILASYDAAIERLQAIQDANTALVLSINQRTIAEPANYQERMILARENQRELQRLRATRAYFEVTYLIPLL